MQLGILIAQSTNHAVALFLAGTSCAVTCGGSELYLVLLFFMLLCCRDVAQRIMGLREHLPPMHFMCTYLRLPKGTLSMFFMRLCRRDIAERIMGLREHIAQEMQEELGLIQQANSDINRR
jgi:hypothetical protein